MTRTFTEHGLGQLRQVAVAHVGPDKVPGLVVLVSCGDDVHAEALGEMTIGGPPMQRDTLFRIASTTKPITGATAMVLVGEGLIDLDEPVDRLLPELAVENVRVLRKMDGLIDDTVPAARAITPRDLLTFTFGFGMAVEMFMSEQTWPVVEAEGRLRVSTLGPPAPDMQPEPNAWMEELATLPLIAQPGERWLYNTSASVLGVLLARAAGQPIGDVMRTRIFEPLGMADTAFFAADPTRLPTEYAQQPEGLVVWDEPDGRWSHLPAFGDGAAGLISSADDLNAFGRMFLRGGAPILSPEAVREMTTSQLKTAQLGSADAFLGGRSWAFCQAVAVDGPRAGAFGWDGGLGTSWLVDPARDLVAIVLTQRMWASAELPPVHTELNDAAYHALAG